MLAFWFILICFSSLNNLKNVDNTKLSGGGNPLNKSFAKKLYPILAVFAGLINGLLGAGGGMLIVPILKKYGLDQRSTHATSVCIILPICLLSAIIYLIKGSVTIFDALPYLPFSVLGAIIGSLILAKINQELLGKLFGVFMIWAAVQLLLR